MAKRRILIQLDTDPHASVFDGVVAVDAGIDFLFQYAGVRPDSVRGLVHGAMFTRGPADLQSTAIFVGGSDVELGRAVADSARSACFDPFRVSIAHDSNGCNSTAAGAVLCAAKHLELSGTTALVMAGTGPVGQVVAQLLAARGGRVYVASRQHAKAAETCQALADRGTARERLVPIGSDQPDAWSECLASIELVISCGAAGVTLLTNDQLAKAEQLRVAIDLNAVPPAGIEGIQVTDQAVERGGRVDYGALGVGGLKMKIHKAAIRAMFESNREFIDAARMMTLGEGLVQ